MKETIIKIEKALQNELKNVQDLVALNSLKINYLGKRGKITLLKKELAKFSDAEKKEFGRMFNELKVKATTLIEEKVAELEEQAFTLKLKQEEIDVTLPATNLKKGTKHPLTIMIEEIEELFISMGYDVISGPEIELDLYNFERLNLPKNHPARDMQDSLYITGEVLLRTHTSPAQARYMEANKEKTPIRIICPGKVYRKDEDDATHSHQFMQFEGLVVDKNLSVANLKATLELLVQKLFGQDAKIRFRPSYFPFTEPSFEVDVTCFKCQGAGCRICKDTGWLEILGAGMVHPEVLKMGGYDPEVFSGFAFGPGPDRMVMLKYGVNDIRQLYLNNIDFLKQFGRLEKEEN